jgi:hypothetical protein
LSLTRLFTDRVGPPCPAEIPFSARCAELDVKFATIKQFKSAAMTGVLSLLNFKSSEDATFRRAGNVNNQQPTTKNEQTSPLLRLGHLFFQITVDKHLRLLNHCRAAIA